eukprot:SAG31_NODE_35378_length_323_cov_1.580357_1_plen_41_part_10
MSFSRQLDTDPSLSWSEAALEAAASLDRASGRSNNPEKARN